MVRKTIDYELVPDGISFPVFENGKIISARNLRHDEIPKNLEPLMKELKVRKNLKKEIRNALKKREEYLKAKQTDNVIPKGIVPPCYDIIHNTPECDNRHRRIFLLTLCEFALGHSKEVAEKRIKEWNEQLDDSREPWKLEKEFVNNWNNLLKKGYTVFPCKALRTEGFCIYTPEELVLCPLKQKKELGTGEIPIEINKILTDPELFSKITDNEFDKKIVGEKESRKVIFLCAQGRLVKNNQIASYNLLVNDEAGTGKDYVTAAALEILPEEIYIHKTRISPTVLTYWHNSKFEPEWTWDGKVFYNEDISQTVLNSDPFKVMCSKGSSATVTINQMAVEIEIKGKPVMIATTASAIPSAEATRRFVILNLDSSINQTKAIMKRHSKFKENGIVPEYDRKYTEAMKYLKRVNVKVPFASKIDEHFPVKNIIMRTHYPRFLDFIAASAAFYQYQREKDENDYVIANGQDYDIARKCFLKLCSNKYMIPLTINQKKILNLLEENPDLRGSVTKLHGDKMGFISLPALQTNLGLLVRYGIVESETEQDTYGRDVEVYSLSKTYQPSKQFTIPTYDTICRNTLTSLTTKTSLTPLIPLPSNRDVKDTKDVKAQKRLLDTKKPLNFCPTCQKPMMQNAPGKLYCGQCGFVKDNANSGGSSEVRK